MPGQLKRAFKKIICSSLSSELILGFVRKRKLADRVVVLMYHEIAEDADNIEAWTVVRKSDFIRHMEYLMTHFEVVSLGQALSVRSGAGLRRPLAVVTFDDGYSGNRNILLPIAKSMGLPVSIFVATSAVVTREPYWYDRIINAVQTDEQLTLDLSQHALGNYAINRTSGAENWAEIEKLLRALKALEPLERGLAVELVMSELKGRTGQGRYALEHLDLDALREMAQCELITFGAHSHCHSLLPQLGTEAMQQSVKTSRKLLEEWTGKKVDYFAYPGGVYDERVIKVLGDSGFSCALTTKSKPWEGEPFFEIPRVGVGRYDSLDLFKVKISNALKFY